MYSNPIAILGYTEIKQYSIFKHHLKIPLVYLKVLLRFYRKDLTQVPTEFPCFLEKFHSFQWSQMEDKSIIEKKYRIAGVPVAYIRDNSIPNGKGESLKAYQAILMNIEKFISKPRVMYFHSTMSTNSLLACSNILKKTVESGVSCYCIDFPTYISEIKTWETSDKLKKAEKAKLLVIWAIGTEYSTMFTKSYLESLLAKRQADGLATILCSFLNEKEFKSRYGKDVPGVSVEFKDETTTQTVKDLIAELEE